jgi:hypothetical protein
MIPAGPMPSARVGPPVPSFAGSKELRQSLPPALFEALDRIGAQIVVDVIDPLLSAGSVEQCARTFELVFPRFRDYYTSTLLILWGFLQEDPQRFSALTIRSFEEAESFIRSNGPHWIGQDATLNALHARRTIMYAVKTATSLLDPRRAEHGRDDPSAGEAWANSTVAFVMAFSAVLSAVTALATGRNTSTRLENAAVLAHWSKNYAVRVYHLTKALGLLKTTPAAAPIDANEAEDEILAESGLDSYVKALVEDDRP